MGYTTTPVDAIQIPDNKEYLNQAWKFSGIAATQLEPFTVMRFASMTELAAKLVGATLAPKNGMIVYIAADSSFYGYAGNAWHRIYPTESRVFSGTGIPAASLGNVNDVYIQV